MILEKKQQQKTRRNKTLTSIAYFSDSIRRYNLLHWIAVRLFLFSMLQALCLHNYILFVFAFVFVLFAVLCEKFNEILIRNETRFR